MKQQQASVKGLTPSPCDKLSVQLLTSSLGLQQKCVAVVPEEQTSISKLVDGADMSFQAATACETCEIGSQTHITVGNSLDVSPLLHHGFEAIRIGCHELICLSETELNWVVTSVKRVV